MPTKWRVDRRHEEGAALLQGRAVCGRCGRHFRVSICDAPRKAGSLVCLRPRPWLLWRAELPNRSQDQPIDEAIGALVTERMTPAAIELALEIRREIEAR